MPELAQFGSSLARAVFMDSYAEQLRALSLSPERVSSGHAPDGGLQEEVLRLFEELRNPLLRYLLFVGVARDIAEEISQETFLRLFEHLRKDKSRENLRGWVFRVAHNLAAKQRRSARFEASRIEEDLTLPSRLSIDPSPDPEARAVIHQKQSRLLAAIANLPEQERQCLHLRAEGLRYREISDVLGIGTTTVWESLRRAIEELRRAVYE